MADNEDCCVSERATQRRRKKRGSSWKRNKSDRRNKRAKADRTQAEFNIESVNRPEKIEESLILQCEPDRSLAEVESNTQSVCLPDKTEETVALQCEQDTTETDVHIQTRGKRKRGHRWKRAKSDRRTPSKSMERSLSQDNSTTVTPVEAQTSTIEEETSPLLGEPSQSTESPHANPQEIISTEQVSAEIQSAPPLLGEPSESPHANPLEEMLSTDQFSVEIQSAPPLLGEPSESPHANTPEEMIFTEQFPVETSPLPSEPLESPLVSLVTKSRILKIKDDLSAINVLPQEFTMSLNANILSISHYYVNTAGVVASIAYVLCIDETLNATLYVHRKQVLDTHEFWSDLSPKVETHQDVLKILNKLCKYSVCIGNPDEEFTNMFSRKPPSGSGVAYLEGDFGASKHDLAYAQTVRTANCSLLIVGARCQSCSKYRGALRSRLSKQRRNTEPSDMLSYRKPLSVMGNGELVEKCKQLRQYATNLESKIDFLKKQIQKDYDKKLQSLPDDSCEDVHTLFTECQPLVEESFPDPESFQRLFWDQQKKYALCGKKSSMRWHPMIIRWCLYLKSKSAKAYSAMRETGFINLPSERTLFDYSHCVEPGTGIKLSVLEMLVDHCEKEGYYENPMNQFVGILHDEVKVKNDLVYNKHTGDLVGFVDLNSVANDILQLRHVINTDEEVLATQVLVIMVRGIFTKFKFVLAHYATTSITADFLYPLIWEAVEEVENFCGLKVLFNTCDGASPNRRFFQLHSEDAGTLVNCTINPFAEDGRMLYFVSDAPHLMKTARNCFSNSFSHKKSRSLLVNGKNISWMHIVEFYRDYCQGIWALCPKLSPRHLNLTAFSCMNVSLAAQTMSSAVANGLELNCGPHVSETVRFIRMFNKFFDITNVRCMQEHTRKRNPDVAPFTESNDPRLTWLENDFLGYFDNWKIYIEGLPNLSKKEIAARQLSYQTLNGLKITVRSIVAMTRFLLQAFPGSFLLTNRFNQDALEQHFGHYRHKGGANDNPTVNEVGHIITTLRTTNMFALAPVRGNTGRQVQDRNIINPDPLPRRHRPYPRQ